ncbi:hypothetical protein VTJ04DRAFT_2574 [Mycothermus thermophilus]|uniref:uncharacterized protein n=1 Tax=Humicola insolens TaxID=85995 RepID=UPI003742CD3E
MNAAMPLGFFENTREVYAEVASYPVVPLEKIKQYWNAYTTTFRRLFDPSAFRLENFWWHVWGSERLRNLSGPQLAKLYEEFSTGPTFVPIPPPPNPFLRAKSTTSRRQEADGNKGGAAPKQQEPQQGSSPAENRKKPTPSSSRPPPPHPILKKSRGPSSSGPRPTARFASLPKTEPESIKGNEDESNTTSSVATAAEAAAAAAAAAAAMPPPPLPSRIKNKQSLPPATDAPLTKSPESTSRPTPPSETSSATMNPPPPPQPKVEKPTTTRKIVASTVASRRRPVLVRRTSSQAGPDPSSRGAGAVTASKRSSSKRSAPTSSQLAGGQGSSSSQTSDAGLTMKALAKSGKASVQQAPPQPTPPKLEQDQGAASAKSPRKESQKPASETTPSRITTENSNIVTKPPTEQPSQPPHQQSALPDTAPRARHAHQPTPPRSQPAQTRVNSEPGDTGQRSAPMQNTPPSSQTSHARISSSLGRTMTRPLSNQLTVKPPLPVQKPQTGADADPITAAPLLLQPTSPQRRSTWDVRDSIATTAQSPPPVAGFVADQPFAQPAAQPSAQTFGRRVPSILRTRSKRSDASQGGKEVGVALLPAQPTSSVVLATTTAVGQIESETSKTVPAVPDAPEVPDQAGLNPKVNSSVFQQFRPTPRHPAPPIPFGRSKSELTLLLERGKPDKGKSQRKEAP